MLPNFLMIGAPRAGTTWVAKNLIEHPDVFMPKKKELHYFDRHLDKGIEYYEAYFSDVANEKAIGEVTPAYLALRDAPRLIKSYMPEVKLVVTLRNPVDRLYSRYLRGKGNYLENEGLSFEEKIKLKPFLIEEGFYYDHLSRYYEHFPREQVLVLLYDDLVSDPRSYLGTICKFIGVADSFDSAVVGQQINRATQQKLYAKSRFLWYITKGLDKVKALRLANMLRRANENSLPAMKKETREWLIQEVYKEKNLLLERLIDRDLGAWNRL